MSVIDQIKYVIRTVDCQLKITEVTPEAYEFLELIHCHIIGCTIKSREKCYDYSDKYLEWDHENDFNSYNVLQNLGGFITTNDLYNMALRQITKVLNRVVLILDNGAKPTLQELLDLYYSFYPKNIQLKAEIIGQNIVTPLAGLAFVVLCEYLLAEILEGTINISKDSKITKDTIIKAIKKDAELYQVFHSLLNEEIEESEEEVVEPYVTIFDVINNEIFDDKQRILALETKVKTLEHIIISMEKQMKKQWRKDIKKQIKINNYNQMISHPNEAKNSDFSS